MNNLKSIKKEETANNTQVTWSVEKIGNMLITTKSTVKNTQKCINNKTIVETYRSEKITEKPMSGKYPVKIIENKTTLLEEILPEISS